MQCRDPFIGVNRELCFGIILLPSHVIGKPRMQVDRCQGKAFERPLFSPLLRFHEYRTNNAGGISRNNVPRRDIFGHHGSRSDNCAIPNRYTLQNHSTCADENIFADEDAPRHRPGSRVQRPLAGIQRMKIRIRDKGLCAIMARSPISIRLTATMVTPDRPTLSPILIVAPGRMAASRQGRAR